MTVSGRRLRRCLGTARCGHHPRPRLYGTAIARSWDRLHPRDASFRVGRPDRHPAHHRRHPHPATDENTKIRDLTPTPDRLKIKLGRDEKTGLPVSWGQQGRVIRRDGAEYRHGISGQNRCGC